MARDVVLKRDVNSDPLQALTPYSGTVVNGTLGAVSVRIALPTPTNVVRVIRVSSTGNAYIALGDNTVTATTSDILFPIGSEIWTVDNTVTHLAALQVGTDTGVFGIVQMV